MTTSAKSGKEEFFDEHGRCIPDGITSAVYEETRRYYQIPKININYIDIYNRIKNHLGSNGGITPEDFKKRSEAILSDLELDPTTKNITKGPAVPFFIPKDNIADIGSSLVTKYIKALDDSFSQENPTFEFINHCTEDLTDNLKVISDSRHQKILDMLQDRTIVGYYFPSLSEYSVPAAVERLQTLPNKFLLAGGVDTCAAFIGSPNLLLREVGYPPLLWMTALEGPSTEVAYHIEAYGYNLTFNRRAHLGQVAEYWSHALVVLG